MNDVIIIGGGPAGSYTARLLAENGISVAILEQKENTDQPVCCTGIISRECMERFGIDESLVLRELNSARIFSPSGEEIKVWRPQTQACIIDRVIFNKTMADLAWTAGAQYITDCQVRKIDISADGVTVEAIQGNDKEIMKARAVVVASGFGNKLTDSLKLGKIADFTLGVQADVTAPNLTEVEVYTGQDVAPNYFAWLVPTTNGLARLGLLCRRQPKKYLRNLAASLTAKGKIGEILAELPPRRLPMALLPKTFNHRLLVVGDAAGHVKPTTGGGIYYGLLCAEIAAKTLTEALEEDNLSAKRLAAYQENWKALLGKDIMLGNIGRRFYHHLSDGQLDKTFKLAKQSGIIDDLLKEESLTFDWHGRVVMSLARRRFTNKLADMFKKPFHIGRIETGEDNSQDDKFGT